MKAFPELTAALGELLDRLDASLRAAGYGGPPIRMYVAGGIAVNYYCGTRYTEDVDASFSHRFILPKDLTVGYRRRDGSEAFIYFDQNYNTSFALLHEDFEENTLPWAGMEAAARLVQLRVLAPLDLAVSKVARFSAQDRADIAALAAEGCFTATDLRRHATAAMQNYIGDKRPLTTSLDLICRQIEGAATG
jgi:hypothetical protein